MMTLRGLMYALEQLRADGADWNSPVIVEGHGESDEKDFFLQAEIGAVKTEYRCEEDGALKPVYIDLSEINMD